MPAMIPLLAQLPEVLRGQGVELELHVLGSSESLASLERRTLRSCRLSLPPRAAWAPAVMEGYRGLIWIRAHVPDPLCPALPGLMLAAAIRKSWQALRDLKPAPASDSSNRQAGSGTRLLLDLLLADQRLEPRDIAVTPTRNSPMPRWRPPSPVARPTPGLGRGGGGAAFSASTSFPVARKTTTWRRGAMGWRIRLLGILLKCLAAPPWRRSWPRTGYVARGSGKLVECENAWRTASDSQPGNASGTAAGGAGGPLCDRISALSKTVAAYATSIFSMKPIVETSVSKR